MTPQLAVKLLIDYMEQHFLPGLLRMDPPIIDALRHCECGVDLSDDGIAVEGRLPNYFNSVWRSANQDGANLPTSLDWQKCYSLFKRELDREWITAKFKAAGFRESKILGHQKRTHRIYLISDPS